MSTGCRKMRKISLCSFFKDISIFNLVDEPYLDKTVHTYWNTEDQKSVVDIVESFLSILIRLILFAILKKNRKSLSSVSYYLC